MGALVSDFPGLPADGDPHRLRLFVSAYQALTALGLALPGTPASTITRAALLTHLQAVAGQLVKDELTGNPDGLNYGGTDVNTADEIGKPYSLAGARRWPGANLTGYRTLAGSTNLGIVCETNPGAADPGLLGAVFAELAGGNGAIRFRAATPTVQLQGRIRQIRLVVASNQIGLAGPVPIVIPPGEIFDLGVVVPSELPARMAQVLRGFPFAPNVLTAADIASAKL